jgi:hypothetical protein
MSLATQIGEVLCGDEARQDNMEDMRWRMARRDDLLLRPGTGSELFFTSGPPPPHRQENERGKIDTSSFQ